ncbi:MAG: hypothetical protein LBG66_01740 [Gallionellaceae bacterium]|jgi:hypothetical protein|nr:hypothetical protein [Gallionellaceae bacterium]
MDDASATCFPGSEIDCKTEASIFLALSAGVCNDGDMITYQIKKAHGGMSDTVRKVPTEESVVAKGGHSSRDKVEFSHNHLNMKGTPMNETLNAMNCFLGNIEQLHELQEKSSLTEPQAHVLNLSEGLYFLAQAIEELDERQKKDIAMLKKMIADL